MSCTTRSTLGEIGGGWTAAGSWRVWDDGSLEKVGHLEDKWQTVSGFSFQMA